MRRLDDFLIDRVFQPVADALARWISCYGLAAFLLTGAVLAMITAIALSPDVRSVGVVLLSVVWVVRLIEAHQLDQRASSDVLPAERIRDVYWRPAYLAVVVYDLMVEIFSLSDLRDLMFNQGWLLNTLAVYFMACRKQPPKQRRAHVPAGAVGNEV